MSKSRHFELDVNGVHVIGCTASTHKWFPRRFRGCKVIVHDYRWKRVVGFSSLESAISYVVRHDGRARMDGYTRPDTYIVYRAHGGLAVSCGTAWKQ